MLGILRFVLAAFVVITHLTEGIQFFSHWGVFAVFGFYLVSGYLMTLILNETYSFQFSAFAANRLLRLFPIYYIVAISSAIILFLGPNPGAFHPVWAIDPKLSAEALVGNAVIFPFAFHFASFRLVPPIWSVAVELVNYFLLWLIVARSRKWAVLTALLALSYHAATFVADMHWSKRYVPFYAALLPFSLGACIYFWRHFLATWSTPAVQRLATVSFVIWATNLVSGGLIAGLGGKYFNHFFYMNLVSLCVFVACIATPSFRSMFSRSGKILGDLAYPVFLIHWIVGYAVSVLVLEGQRRGLPLLAISALPILAASFSLAWIAEHWFEPLRTKVRRAVAG